MNQNRTTSFVIHPGNTTAVISHHLLFKIDLNLELRISQCEVFNDFIVKVNFLATIVPDALMLF